MSNDRTDRTPTQPASVGVDHNPERQRRAYESINKQFGELDDAELVRRAKLVCRAEEEERATLQVQREAAQQRAIDEANRKAQERIDAEVEPLPEVTPPPALAGQGIELIPAGFSFNGQPHELTGRPRAMLGALLKAPHQRHTALDLRKILDVDDEAVEFPEQVIRDTASTLREALKIAWKVARRRCKEPLKSAGRGTDLAYILAMP